MNIWKSASEMYAYTQQNIKARDTLVNQQVPFYMDKVMEKILTTANNCQCNCRFELHPEKGEEPKMFDQVLSAICKKLSTLGYSVSHGQTRYGLRISWGSDNTECRM